MPFLTQVPSKSCRTVFGPFMTVFDGLFGADRPRNSRRIKHSSVFHPLAHRLKTVKTVKTAPHRIPTVPVSSLRSGRRRQPTKTHPAVFKRRTLIGGTP